MSKETLKTLRILVPGAMLYIVFLPLFKGSINPLHIFATLNSLKDLFYLFGVILLGGLYYIFDLRGYILRPELQHIHFNIQQRLLNPFRDDPVFSASSDKLRQGRTLLDIFYSLVDNDESLKERAKSVYLNGLVWTTVMDISMIGVIAAVFYASFALGAWRVDYLAAALCMGTLAAVSYWALLPRVTQKHIALSDEQLEYITSQKRAELRGKLITALGTRQR